MLQISLVLQGRPSGRIREAGGGARPTLVPGEELVRGRINKPEIFQTEVNTLLVALRKITYIFIIKQKQVLLICILWTLRKHPFLSHIKKYIL